MFVKINKIFVKYWPGLRLIVYCVMGNFMQKTMGQLRKKQATQAALLLYLITGYFSQMPACSK